MSRSLHTRLLHMLVALSIVHQLIVGSLMGRPRAGGSGDLLWQAHQSVGLASLGILFAFWVWMLLRQGETRMTRLFPWFDSRARSEVLADLRAQIAHLRRLTLSHAEDQPLASAIHGLGLTAATAMAATGAVWFVKDQVPHLFVWLALNLHGALANVMWAYLVAHAGLALLHELLGQRVLRRMSPLGTAQ